MSYTKALGTAPTSRLGREGHRKGLRRPQNTRGGTSPFESCKAEPTYLCVEELARLMRAGFREPEAVRYDSEGLELRAEEKIGQISAHVPVGSWRRCVELGCADGMVGVGLMRMGKTAWGVDITATSFDGRARAEGVRFVQGDVAALPFGNHGFDLAYSFASFEHFRDPDAVLAEAWRTLRTGGYLYLLFGPLYTSPYGLHAYRQIPVPYCHYLFRESDLRTYADQVGMRSDWPYVNRLTVTDYRRLWARYADRFETVYYKEHPTGGVGAELINMYPACFKGKVPAFDDLLVSAIKLCWRKR